LPLELLLVGWCGFFSVTDLASPNQTLAFPSNHQGERMFAGDSGSLPG
jgi:hypothetical protein